MSLQIVYTPTSEPRARLLEGTAEWFDVNVSFSWRTRARLYRMISVRMRQRSAIDRILRLYSRQLRRRNKTSVPRILERILSRQHDKGLSFADAIQPYVPQDEYMILKSGEKAGDIPAALDLLCDIKTRIGRIVRAARSAAGTPIMYLVMIFSYLFFMARMVIPTLLMGMGPGHQPSTSQQVLVFAASLATGTTGGFIVGGIAAVVFGIWFSLPRLTGPLRVLLERIPPWSIYRNIQGYIWISGFIALVRAGMTDVEALNHQMQGATPWLRERLAAILARLGPKGMSLPEAMEDSRLAFPSPEVIDDIEACWGGTGAYERLLESSRIWADEIEAATLAQAAAAKSAANIIMMLLAGGLIVASNNIGSDMGNGMSH